MNGIQTNYNTKTPAFSANIKFTNKFKNQIIGYVEQNKETILKNPLKSIVPGNYMKADGAFNSDKFFRNLKEDIAFETQDEKGTYIFDKAKSYMGRLFSNVKYFDEQGKEVVRDRYRFNPTELLKPQDYQVKRPNVLGFFTNQQDFWSLGKNKAKQAEFYKKQTNLF